MKIKTNRIDGRFMEPYGKSLYNKNPKLKNRKNLHSLGTGKPKKNPINQELKKYIVRVSGTEITDFFVTYSIAKEIHRQYEALGYNDVVIQEGRDDNTKWPTHYNTVIPNMVYPEEYPFSQYKDDYLMFMGKINLLYILFQK